MTQQITPVAKMQGGLRPLRCEITHGLNYTANLTFSGPQSRSLAKNHGGKLMPDFKLISADGHSKNFLSLKREGPAEISD
jgi:hypothetical protein